MASRESRSPLKRLPIPPLMDTLQRYLDRIEPLEDDKQFLKTKQTILSKENIDALTVLHEKLIDYDKSLAAGQPKSSYIEQFWYDSYLEYDESVVLNVNPFFQLQDDPTLKGVNDFNGPYGVYTIQVKRTSKLIMSVLKFIKHLRHGSLAKDTIKNTELSMDQYDKLFGSSRIPPGPGEQSCHLQTDKTSHHIIVIYKSQFYWFDVLDVNNLPIFGTAEEIEWNLYSIITDGNKNSDVGINKYPFGVFTTENRRVWSNIRDYIFHNKEDRTNWQNLKIIDSALFVICLDDTIESDENEVIKSMLCGTSKINLDFNALNKHGTESDLTNNGTKLPLNIQCGTCLNRWYDKLQIIITQNGKAGINFEHTGIDGHTVLRLAVDIYTDSILSFAQGITANLPNTWNDIHEREKSPISHANLITIPRKLEWKVDTFLLSSLHFAETRISDLISQYEFISLQFNKFGSNHIKKSFTCSPDAFVQQIMQIAYYALYGKFETTYEPAMTKNFQNGRTEAIRSVTNKSKDFVKSMFDKDSNNIKRQTLLHAACKEHSRITRECSSGLGQDRHLYALYSIWNVWNRDKMELPPIFKDRSWHILNNNVLSTSNCGNSCLKSFGFGPVTANGFGIGYIIGSDSISIVVSSRHRQTQRFASLIERSMLEIDRLFNATDDEDTNRDYLMDMYNTSKDERSTIESKSEDLKFLLSGYDYFDVSVTG
ncbi:hypothetical protein KAFR_0F02280 [Kazachstania africana CBS 2517]|uniref:Choline/carnitine acyltransferase domain-containing protein n=1 Tax=Kazachstania africana (strain ATCC 22294 / BCRC 22015 / CBS 2517 / CECT 1963 / NBRC 1671 / NRRL Y-8276) TaxID=1071382 RepID=H2AWS5_KAZAF|nr:hypothetical protein KAFR_0F02280 [Kazachstania africana CBS 2517]CCF58825.1 hypothetical protein KAFR_0F02280 [Kazachstania africana CBS 2517]